MLIVVDFMADFVFLVQKQMPHLIILIFRHCAIDSNHDLLANVVLLTSE